MTVFDPVVTVLDRLHAAHDAARCADMQMMWAAKIRQFQRKQGVTYDFSDPDAGLRHDNGADIVLLDRQRGLKQ